jgi:hypothetical protein
MGKSGVERATPDVSYCPAFIFRTLWLLDPVKEHYSSKYRKMLIQGTVSYTSGRRSSATRLTEHQILHENSFQDSKSPFNILTVGYSAGQEIPWFTGPKYSPLCILTRSHHLTLTWASTIHSPSLYSSSRISITYIIPLYKYNGGRDTSLGMATRHGFDSSGFEHGQGQEILCFSQLPRPSPLYNGYRPSLPGVKRPGYSVDYPP